MWVDDVLFEDLWFDDAVFDDLWFDDVVFDDLCITLTADMTLTPD